MEYNRIDLSRLSIPNGGAIKPGSGGSIIYNDGSGAERHLLLYSDQNIVEKKISLRLSIEAHPDCSTDFYIHHWGALDVAVISNDGIAKSTPRALSTNVKKGADGIIIIETVYCSSHPSIIVGTYSNGQLYHGFGRDQYIIHYMEYRLETPSLGEYFSADDAAIRRAMKLYHQHLKPRGWGYPTNEGPVDANHAPLPWFTYPSQTALKQIVHPNFRVFEFGCGNSSLWWSSFAKEVVSVDHDPGWIERLRRSKPDNLQLIHCGQSSDHPTIPSEFVDAFNEIIDIQPRSGNLGHDVGHGLNCADFIAYAMVLLRWPRNYFDVIVVDGMARSLCAYIAGQCVKPSGIIVFDNSDRWQYAPGFEALREMRFGRIDFFGTGPINSYEWCTSLFLKSIDAFLEVPPREKLSTDLGW
jgi:SAM-dependent methyltransferase